MLIFYLAMLETDEEKAKFEELYEKYKTYMSGVALSRAKDEIVAKDSVQNAFVAIAKCIDRLPTDMSPEFEKRYMRKVILNSLSNEWRRTKKNALPLCIEENIIDEFDYTDLDDETAELARSLNKLPPTYVDTMTLYYIDGIKVSEIAVLFGISKFTVYSRIRRGTALLKKMLEAKNE